MRGIIFQAKSFEDDLRARGGSNLMCNSFGISKATQDVPVLK